MSYHDDYAARRLAIQLAGQMAEEADYCLKVVEHLRHLVVEFLTKQDAPPSATVIPLRPVN